MKSLLAYLDQNDFERIHAASCKVLEETGVVFHDDEVCDLFKKHGAKVEGQTVHIPRTLIDAATKIPRPMLFRVVVRFSAAFLFSCS